MRWRGGRPSLTRRTLAAVALRIALVVAIASVVSYWHVRSGLETQALGQLAQFVEERRARESAIFQLAADDLEIFEQTYAERLGQAPAATAEARFGQLFEARPDGTTRIRRSVFEAQGITGLIGRQVAIDADLMRRLVVAFEVMAEFGPAWQRRFVNLYVITPEQSVLMYWPDEPWALEASDWEIYGKLELVAARDDDRIVVLGENQELPDQRRWSDLYFDYGVNDWLVSITEPVASGERHLLSVGHDILLRELIERSLDSRIEGTYGIVVAPDGRLIAHPKYMEAIQAQSGDLTVEQTGDTHLARILEQAKDLTDSAVVLASEADDEFLAVTRLEGPGWFLITVFPHEIVTTTALETARLVFLLGLAALLLEILILYTTLRKRVAAPLTSLIGATRELAAGKFDVELATERQDELGELARSFATMAGEVRERELALSERSASLADVNARLERELEERKRVEAEVARQREALHQSEKLNALGSLLAGVAHELNNPLSVVVGHASLLEERLRDRPEGEAVAKIQTAAKRCADIVRTFVAMARQEEPSRRAVRIDEVVQGTLAVVGFGLRRADIEVELDLPPTLPTFSADPSQLTQVLTNLLLNAQHAMEDQPPPRRIRVTATEVQSDGPGAGEVVLAVEDNGPGIPAAVRPRVFEPFFSTKPQGKGTGLGLSVCRGMVEAHGGSIEVVLPVWGGCRFEIRLPVEPAPMPQAVTAAAPEPTGGDRILVVEDEPDLMEMLADILLAAGFRVETAASGRIALERVADARFDLVLSDFRMPDLDGAGLYRELSDRQPELAARVVFLTGDSLSQSAAEFLDACGRPVIEKPFTPEDIRRVVRDELARLAV